MAKACLRLVLAGLSGICIPHAHAQGADEGQRRAGEAAQLRAEAGQLAAAGRWDEATARLQSSMLVAARSGREQPLAETMLATSRLYAERSRSPAATFWAKQSIKLLMRPDPATGQWKANADDAFDQLFELLVQQGRFDELQQALRARGERELYEDLASAQDEPLDLPALALSPAEHEAEQQLEQALAPRAPGPAGPPGVVGSGGDEAGLQRIFRSVDNTETLLPPAASLPPPGIAAAVEAAARDGADVTGLQLAVIGDRLLQVVHRAGAPMEASVRPLDATRLRHALRLFSVQLASPQADVALVRESAARLYDDLLRPVEARFPAPGPKALLLLELHGALRNLPYAALHDGTSWLIERLPLALHVDDRVAAARNVATSRWRVAALGASQGISGRPPLVAARDEVLGIVAQPNTSGDVWLDERFDRSRLQNLLSAGSLDYQVLHIASHFVLVPDAVEQSRLYLGDRSTLTLADIGRDNFRFDAFELVALSACDTGTSPRAEPNGRLLDSFATTASRRGAQAVLASLWSVADRSTSALMKGFYRAHGASGASKAQALRTAQVEMLRGGSGAPAGWTRPFHWAGFVLIGDWR